MDDALRDRLRDDPALARALAVALDRAEAGDGTVTWATVGDALDAEQWGRLLAADLLVPAGDRFVVADPTAARAVLDDCDVEPGAAEAAASDDPSAVEGTADTDDATSWTRRDKVAGVASLALMASYQFAPARDAVGQAMHAVLGPVEAALPFVATVALLAVATTVVTTALQRRLRDAERMERVKERMEDVRERLSAARERGDEAAVERLEAEQRDLLTDQFAAMKGLLRPMAWTVLVTAPVFLWLSWLVAAPAAAITPAATVFPFLGRVAWTARLVGPVQAWMVWYVGCSLLSSLTLRRVADRVAPAASA
ncbi:DUF106 domain-containing protein [Halomicrobium salinisoli]|uniref:DUF106 domain-containing protein n=1 Tax=Halomicrobium salinisoli TaxID=2878391 RepID=UPI001CF0D432|nr:EMC3/TMCO1 family protein [Halomicrobium salinisoli]